MTCRSSHSRCLVKNSQLFQPLPTLYTEKEQLEASYQRARAIGRAYAFTGEDIVNLTEKFWAMHRDAFGALDAAAYTLATIQYNLAAGTLAPFALRQPQLQPLLKSILNFDVSAQYLLTEVGHGLDSPNLETTATLLGSGEFDLHTPNSRAAKYMPPTLTVKAFPRVAIVIARLVVEGEDRGVRPFLVVLGDGIEMAQGVTGRMLPARGGSKHVDHALTYFNHVRLPPQALLGRLEKPRDLRENFLKVIWRVSVGSLALSTLTPAALETSAYIAGKYSLRRTVKGPKAPVPIFSFRTQQLPIMHSLAAGQVLDAYSKDAARQYVKYDSDHRVSHGIAAALKAVMSYHIHTWLVQLSERCGAQGMFKHNRIAEIELDQRGVFIAEGDVLVLCIRLASELLISRYELPATLDPTSLLARHEIGLFDECKKILDSFNGAHRSDGFNHLLLPLAQPLISAIGHRMAYDAAIEAKVDPDIIRLFEVGVIKQDPAWYSEKAGISRDRQHRLEDEAISRLLPRIEEFLDATGAGPFATAPILSEERNAEYIASLPFFDGQAYLDLYPQNGGSGEADPRIGILPSLVLSKL